jgi:3-methyl-2-oxobutanoate hydroxymethyltransferase
LAALDAAAAANFLVLRPNAGGRILIFGLNGQHPGTGVALESAMSLTHFRTIISQSPAMAPGKITSQTLQEKKAQGKPIVALTAYDYATARLVDEAGVDIVLVGDSLAMVVLGHESTLPVTMEEMLHHTRATRRAVRRAMLVADMPFGSYQASLQEGISNATRFLKEAGAEAVKIEGGAQRVELVQELTNAEIPVMAHLGLTPQSVHKMGGYKVQGKTVPAIRKLIRDALALEAAGAFSLVLEGVPREVAQRVTAALKIPVIGIGAGPECDGQILVLHDLLNMTFAPPAKFVRRYADVGAVITKAVEDYSRDVRARSFPGEEESYHLRKEALEALDEEGARVQRKA